MMASLTSKEDSDRLIRDLMKKSKDLEKQLSSMKKASADSAAALQEAQCDRAAMAEQVGQLQDEQAAAVCFFRALIHLLFACCTLHVRGFRAFGQALDSDHRNRGTRS
jgi:hypothetical protein